MDKILWIEDEAKIALMHYKTALVRAGYSVDIAVSATEAIQFLTRIKYNIVIFDLIIPCGEEYLSEDRTYPGLDLLTKLIKNQLQGISVEDDLKIIVFTVVNDPGIHKKIRDLQTVKSIIVKSENELTELKDAIDSFK